MQADVKIHASTASLSHCLQRVCEAEFSLVAAREALSTLCVQASYTDPSYTQTNGTEEQTRYTACAAPSPLLPEVPCQVPQCFPDAGLSLHVKPSMLSRVSTPAMDMVMLKPKSDRIKDSGGLPRATTWDLSSANGSKKHFGQRSATVTELKQRRLSWNNPGDTAIAATADRPSHVQLPGFMRVAALRPDSQGRLAWMFAGLILTIYEAFAIPLYLSFEIESTGALFWFTSITNTYFIMDIPLQFLTGFLDGRGILILDLRRIICRYVRTWLFLDLMAALPWEWFTASFSVLNGGSTTIRGARLVRLIRILRLLRLLRLMKLQSYTLAMEQHIESNRLAVFALEVLRLLFALSVIIHWGACLFHAVGARDTGDKTWIDALPAEVSRDKLQTYTWSLYFTMATMSTVGYGDIAPQSFFEVQFTIVLLGFSTLVFSSLMGVLMELIGNLRSQARDKNIKRMALARYLKWRAVPAPVVAKIRQYMIFTWTVQEGFDQYEKTFLSMIPAVLQSELCFHIFGKVLKESPFLAWLAGYTVCLKKLSVLVQSSIFEKNDIIFRKGAVNDEITIIISGCVRISQNETLHESAGSGVLNVASSSSQGIFGAPSRMISRVISTVKTVAIGEGAEFIAEDVTNTRKYPYTDCPVFQRAITNLQLKDEAETQAARILQRRFRRNRMQKAVKDLRFKSGVFAQEMPSQMIEAPAYFGESCLWVPFEEWGTAAPPRYAYSATCHSRGERITVTRKSLEQVMISYSPWLVDRFEFFRETVFEEMVAIRSCANQKRKPNNFGEYDSDQEQDWRPPAPPDLQLPRTMTAPPDLQLLRTMTQESLNASDSYQPVAVELAPPDVQPPPTMTHHQANASDSYPPGAVVDLPR
mmetsp:Transcript_28414/g.45627  ORF Transcript_28414/g.45627 Transcript_28414/m.45627 type:complete len:872 (+) Transcript_28414:93-2708(+)